MARRIFLKPAKGLAVWLPARGRRIFPEGENVAVDSYVSRCIAEGALVEVKETTGPQKLKTSKPKHKGDK